MTNDQQNQTVFGNQYNIDGNAVFNTTNNYGNQDNSSRVAIITTLNSVQTEVAQQVQMARLDARIAAEVNARVSEALKQLQQSSPAKKPILEQLDGAKKLLDGLTSASGLVSALVKAADLVRNLLL